MRLGSFLPFLLVVGANALAFQHAKVSAPINNRLDSLQVVGEFEHTDTSQVIFGDTDHDGMNEIFLRATTPEGVGVLRILEQQDTGQFAVSFEGANLIPLAVGDADQDGKSDLVAQIGTRLVVFESHDEESFPSSQAWQSPPISSGLGYDEIVDTDSDGRLEIVHRFWAGETRFVIFECQTDNTYIQRFLSPPQEPQGLAKLHQSEYSPWTGDDLVFDLDEDGQPEIVLGDLDGNVRIYESPADDAWELIFADSTGLSAVDIMSGGVDTDGDGTRELFVAGDDNINYDRTVFVYQPDGDRSFVRVGTWTYFDNASGPLAGAIARLEPGEAPHFVWRVYQQLRLYAARSPGQWVLKSVIPSSAHFAVYARDLNRNGRDEIYWVSGTRTRASWILERPTLPTDVEEVPAEPLARTVRVVPSPSRGQVTVYLDAGIAKHAAELTVVDAAGRLVQYQVRQVRADQPAWILPAQRLRPGIYFLRVADAFGRSIATGRATVVR